VHAGDRSERDTTVVDTALVSRSLARLPVNRSASAGGPGDADRRLRQRLTVTEHTLTLGNRIRTRT